MWLKDAPRFVPSAAKTVTSAIVAVVVMANPKMLQ